MCVASICCHSYMSILLLLFLLLLPVTNILLYSREMAVNQELFLLLSYISYIWQSGRVANILGCLFAAYLEMANNADVKHATFFFFFFSKFFRNIHFSFCGKNTYFVLIFLLIYFFQIVFFLFYFCFRRAFLKN